METIIIIDELATGITQERVNRELAKAGEDYVHFINEQYPVSFGAGMRERIILIHKNAKPYYPSNIELGRVFAFSKEDAEKEWKSCEEELYG